MAFSETAHRPSVDPELPKICHDNISVMNSTVHDFETEMVLVADPGRNWHYSAVEFGNRRSTILGKNQPMRKDCHGAHHEEISGPKENPQRPREAGQ